MKKNSDRLSVLLTLVFFVLIATLTVGYAFTDKILTIGGTVEVYRIGKFEIEKVEKISGNLPKDNGQGLILNDEGLLGLDLKFKYSKSGENIDKTTFDEYLAKNKNAFENWRYYYEKGKEVNIRFLAFFATALNNATLQISQTINK